MSEKPTVFESVAAVMNEVKAVGKDGKNRFDDYNFRGIDGVLNAVGPALRKHDVLAVPVVDQADYGQTTTRKGAVMTTVRIKMTVKWYGPAGDSFDTVVWGEAFDRGDKATAKAHSVAFRTALLQTLALPTQEPDPDEYSYEQEAQSREEARKADLQSWADNIMAFEKAGDWDKIEAGMNWARQKGDREKFLYAQGVLQRRPSPQEAQETAQQVLDAEVVTNDPA